MIWNTWIVKKGITWTAKRMQWFVRGWRCRRIVSTSRKWQKQDSGQSEGRWDSWRWVQNNLMSKSASAPASPEIMDFWSSEDWECHQGQTFKILFCNFFLQYIFPPFGDWHFCTFIVLIINNYNFLNILNSDIDGTEIISAEKI